MPDLLAFKGNKDDISMLLLSAERYALGRRTYIVEWVYDVIKANIGLLTNKDKQVMIRDIEQAILCGNTGDVCDEAYWKALLEKLTRG